MDQCLYDTAVESKPSVVPRQAVFTARPSSVALAQETQTASAPTFASSFATPSDFSDQASRVQSVAAVSSAQWLWHGSRGADRYVEPFNGEVIVVPKEVVRGEDDTILHWGRSHMSNFMPFVSPPSAVAISLTAVDYRKHETFAQVGRRRCGRALRN